MKIDLSELRALILSVIEEDLAAPSAPRSVPPPLPMNRPAPAASAALPKPGALNKFKADVNMAADAAARAKEAMDRADTKEALRWLGKVVAFASSAKAQLGVK